MVKQGKLYRVHIFLLIEINKSNYVDNNNLNLHADFNLSISKKKNSANKTQIAFFEFNQFDMYKNNLICFKIFIHTIYSFFFYCFGIAIHTFSESRKGQSKNFFVHMALFRFINASFYYCCMHYFQIV